MNQAFKILPSLRQGRLSQPTPQSPRASCSINCIYLLVNVLFIAKKRNCVNSRVNNFSIVVSVIKEIFVHSDWSRISSYVAMFASHRVITVVSSGTNCEQSYIQ